MASNIYRALGNNSGLFGKSLRSRIFDVYKRHCEEGKCLPNEPLVVMSLQTDIGKMEEIKIYPEDDPAKIAADFSNKHGLSPANQRTLQSIVSNHIEAAIFERLLRFDEAEKLTGITMSPNSPIKRATEALKKRKKDVVTSENTLEDKVVENQKGEEASGPSGDFYNLLYSYEFSSQISSPNKTRRNLTTDRKGGLEEMKLSRSKLTSTGPMNPGERLYVKGAKKKEEAMYFSIEFQAP